MVRTFRLAKPELHALAKSAFTNSYAPQTMVNGWIQELDDYFLKTILFSESQGVSQKGYSRK